MDRETLPSNSFGRDPEIPNLPICCKQHALYALAVYTQLHYKSLLNARTYGEICDRIYQRYPDLRDK